jgi:succinate-semialdehyde dehydrogenase / glutarate-semialdehyde dehydrogenase
MIIGNRRIAAGKGEIEVENPATGAIFAKVPSASTKQINEAVETADKAFPDWARLSPEERGAYLIRAGELVLEREDTIAETLTREQGKPLNEAKGEVRKGAEILRYYAEEGKRIYGRIIPGFDRTTTSYVQYEPVGVAAAISPWNYPVELVAWKVGGALSAGCTVVIKPPSLTPLSALSYIECLIDAGVPAGVVNLVLGAGAEAGTALIEHPKVKKVAFTGSTEAGRNVAARCGVLMKKVSLELGGHCPAIISRNCHLAEAVEGVARRAFRNMGQICIAINRIYVDEKIHTDFMEGLVNAVERLQIADGLKVPDADLGPMANREGIEKTERHIEDAVKKGGKVLTGGGRPAGAEYEKGHFFRPTVIDGASRDMLVMSEESFGPVVGVTTFNSIDDAIEAANSVNYGLASYVYTGDLHEMDEYAFRLESGNVAFNNPDAGVINAPYGGFKESGMGYEHGPEGLREYLRAKHIRIRYYNR